MAPLTWLHPERLLLLVPVLALAFVLIRRRPGEWARARGLALLRLLLAMLLVAALAEPVQGELAARPRLIVLLDQSASLGPEGQAELRARAEALLAREPDAQLIAFGGRPAVVESPARLPDAETLIADASDLAAALELAGRLQDALVDSDGGQIVLLSDGLATRGDAPQAAALLRARGLSVDVWPYVAPDVLDAALLAVDVPRALHAGEALPVGVDVFASRSATATLTVWEDGAVLANEDVLLEPGVNRFELNGSVAGEGRHLVQARVQAPGDARAENDALSAAAWVYPQARVLLIAPRGDGGPLAGLLRAGGLAIDVIAPARLPVRFSELGAYDGIVLANVPASALSLDQALVLQQYARVLGRGLLVVGGPQSYTLGGYAGTPLAAVLPLEMKPPDRPERPPIALLLVVDHSASMGGDAPGSKLALAKESALRAAETLRADDYLGVLIFDELYEWTVPFQQVGEGPAVLGMLDRIAAIPPGGSTRLFQALEIGLPPLLEQPVRTRHALVLTDGQTQDGAPQGFQMLAEQARAAGATISTIAIGADAAVDLTSQIAEWGGGRYHLAANPEDLPELTLQETKVTQSETLQEGDFLPAAPAGHPLLRGIDPAGLPGLTGYLALTPRPGAEIALEAGPGDPLLAVWQYGLGRVVAWTADDLRSWATGWRDWPQAAEFWAQLVRYTLADPELSGQVVVRATDEGGGLMRLAVVAGNEAGRPRNLAAVNAVVTTLDGRALEVNVPLTQVAPGRYEQTVAVPGQGAYFVRVTLRDGTFSAEARTGAVVGYAAEYRPASGGGELLARVAAEGGGRVLASADELLAQRPPPAAEPLALWPWLLGAAALLFPLYVGWRRRAAEHGEG